jgi:hypothetical protein
MAKAVKRAYKYRFFYPVGDADPVEAGDDLAFLNEVSSVPLQQTLRDARVVRRKSGSVTAGDHTGNRRCPAGHYAVTRQPSA